MMWRSRAAVLLMACMLTACAGETPGEPVGQPTTVATVAVTPSSATLVYLGENVQLVATAAGAGGEIISGKTYTWSSSNADVATVSQSGLVTAVANGSADISANTDGVSGAATILVDQAAAYLEFMSQPTTAKQGDAIAPAVRVAIQDSGGGTVADAVDSVTVAIGTNPGSGVLVGTTTVAALGGIASFTDLAIEQEGIGYTLAATSGDLGRTTSARFDVWSSVAHIDSVVLDSDTLAIDGFGVPYTATVSSISSETMSTVVLQGYIRQGAVVQAAGGTQVRCSDVVGDLPPGTCSFRFTLTASNRLAGGGTLVPGEATAGFLLHQGLAGTVLDTLVIPVTLIEFVEPPLPQARINSVNLSSTTLTIGGASVSYTVTLTNEEDSTLSTVVLQGYIDQGAASRAAGGTQVRCSDVVGDLPPGTCSFSFTLRASNALGGRGTLVPGGATARFELKDMHGRILDISTVSVTLVN